MAAADVERDSHEGEIIARQRIQHTPLKVPLPAIAVPQMELIHYCNQESKQGYEQKVVIEKYPSSKELH